MIRLLLLQAILLFATTACAGGAPAGRPNAGEGDPGRPAQPAAQRKTITAAVAYPITAFAPVGQSPMSGNMIVYVEVHTNGLITADAVGRPIPQLARELPSLDNGTIALLPDGRVTTRWTLRSNLTWHDGTRLTAHDIEFGARLHADPEIPFFDRSAVSVIDAVAPIDDQSLTITWKRPFFMAASLGPLVLLPLPSHLLEQEYNLGDKERFRNLPYWTSEYIHAGPFRLSRYEPGRETEFEAHDAYFLGRPKVDSILIREILDRNTIYAATLAGDVDITIYLFEADAAWALADQWQASGGGRVLHTPGPTFLLAFQFAELVSPRALLDVRMRRALYLAVDRRALTDLADGRPGLSENEATNLLPPNEQLYPYVKDDYASLAGDPARALQQFADAGWRMGSDGLLVDAEGSQLSVEVRAARGNLGAATASMWRQQGVDASPLVPPPARGQDREYNQGYPGLDLTGSGNGDRVLDRLSRETMPTARNGFVGNNRGHYDSLRLSELIGAYRSTLRDAERGEVMGQISRAVGDDLPVLPLFFTPTLLTVSGRVRALDDFDGGKPGGYFGLYSRAAHQWEKE